MIMQNPNLPKLQSYLHRMDELTLIRNGNCQFCKRPEAFTYYLSDNITFGLKLDVVCCVPCYQVKFEELRKHSSVLAERLVFFGFKNEYLRRETDCYHKLKPYEENLKYTTFKNLEDWFELAKDNIEDSIVKCDGCNT